MTEDEVLADSRNQIGPALCASRFKFPDERMFTMVADALPMDGVSCAVYALNGIKSHPVTGTSHQFPYTFFIMIPEAKVKNAFIDALARKDRGEPHDAKAIGEYYIRFHPAQECFRRASWAMRSLLMEQFYEGRGYDFGMHLAVLTADCDMAVVFFDQHALRRVAG